MANEANVISSSLEKIEKQFLYVNDDLSINLVCLTTKNNKKKGRISGITLNSYRRKGNAKDSFTLNLGSKEFVVLKWNGSNDYKERREVYLNSFHLPFFIRSLKKAFDLFDLDNEIFIRTKNGYDICNDSHEYAFKITQTVQDKVMKIVPTLIEIEGDNDIPAISLWFDPERFVELTRSEVWGLMEALNKIDLVSFGMQCIQMAVSLDVGGNDKDEELDREIEIAKLKMMNKNVFIKYCNESDLDFTGGIESWDWKEARDLLIEEIRSLDRE